VATDRLGKEGREEGGMMGEGGGWAEREARAYKSQICGIRFGKQGMVTGGLGRCVCRR
jgi:hypothetical protein